MLRHLATTWEYVRTSFWMVPTIMALAAIGGSFILVAVDSAYPASLSSRIGWIAPPRPEAARTLLSALVQSTITVVSVVFSITIVSLTLAASQLGPRLLRTFTIDRANHIVLGTFIATFLYCLLTLWMVGLFDTDVVPELTILGALLLAVASVGVLIFFIHHMAQSIQAPHVVMTVGNELQQAIENIYPPLDGSLSDSPEISEEQQLPGEVQVRLRGWRNAYLQYVDIDRLIQLAEQHDLHIRTNRRPGHFVFRGELLAEIASSREVETALRMALEACFVVGSRRTPTQDVEFAIDQLVEVALRALSPSLNDPFTAMQVMDQLGAALTCLAKRRIPRHTHVDQSGTVRLIVNATDFPGIVNAMFHQIRQSARGHVAVLVHMMDVLVRAMAQTQTDQQRHSILVQAEALFRQSEQQVHDPDDLEDVRQRYELIASWNRSRSSPPEHP